MQKPDNPIVCYVTDRHSFAESASVDPVESVLEKIRLAVEAGVDWIQIREKDLSGGRLLELAGRADALTPGPANGRSGTRIYVNDRLDVALAACAAGLSTVAGVHLGGESLPMADAVRWCRAGNAPRGFQIGVSIHTLEQAREAERAGANYVFFGPIFDTPSKRAFGPPQGLQRLSEVCRTLRIPAIAIGGIKESNARDCMRAGASGVAAIRVFQESRSVEVLRPTIARMRAAD